MARSRSYQEDLLKALQDPLEAQEYLNVALEDPNPDVFLLALQDVMEANQKRTQTSTELANIKTILKGLGYRLAIELEKI